MQSSLDRFLASIRKQFLDVVRYLDDMHEYQDMAVDFLEAHPFCALFIDLGLGKTVISLTLIERLLARLEYNRCLVVAPLRVATQTWPTEKRLWGHLAHMSHVLIRPEAYEDEIREAGAAARRESRYYALARRYPPRSPYRRIYDLFASRAAQRAMAVKKDEILRRLANTPASFHLINREQLEWLVSIFGNKWPFDVVIIDESSSLKDHTTARFKAMRKVRRHMKRMHQLTATPAAESYMGLFAQIFLLDRGERFGKYITKFREEYFTYNQYTRVYTLRSGAEDRIAEKISDITLTMKAEDYLDLEKPLFITRPIELSKSEMAAYREFEKEYILDLPDGVEIEAENAAALTNKLLQLASGFVYGEGKKVHRVHDHKIAELQQLVEEADGEPILVAYWFKPSLARLKAAFPKAVEMDKRGLAVDRWNKGEIPMLLVHPQSAGHGLNLQHGGHILAFFDIPWSLELYLQVIGRLARQGQKCVVRIYLLITLGTMDEAVAAGLLCKENVQEGLFSRLKALYTAVKRGAL